MATTKKRSSNSNKNKKIVSNNTSKANKSSTKTAKARAAKRLKRRRQRRIRRLCTCLAIIVFIIGFLFFKRNSIALWRKGYSKEDRKILLELDKKDLKEYLQLDNALDLTEWKEYSNDSHYYDYDLYQKKNKSASIEEVIKYVDDFYNQYPSLAELGYSKEFLRDKMKTFSINDFKTIVQKKYTYDTVIKYIDIKGCQISDLSAYIDSGLEPMQAILSITYPFIDSNNAPNATYKIANPKTLDVLIKKGFVLGSDYEPNDLVKLDLPLHEEADTPYLRKEAANALTKMAEDAKKEGLYLGIRSSYRSYQTQKEVYDYYNSIYGEYYTSQLVSDPGSSEHQLGLGVDLTSQSVIDGTYGSFDQSEEYSWTIQNAHKYGFILRYPEDKTSLTGAMNEPWHFRYVGVDIATEIFENNWTLEEYILNHGFDYDLIRQ